MRSLNALVAQIVKRKIVCFVTTHHKKVQEGDIHPAYLGLMSPYGEDMNIQYVDRLNIIDALGPNRTYLRITDPFDPIRRQNTLFGCIITQLEQLGFAISFEFKTDVLVGSIRKAIATGTAKLDLIQQILECRITGKRSRVTP
jgi:hypothetical protein